MAEFFLDAGATLFNLMTKSETEYEWLDEFVNRSSDTLLIAAFLGLLMFVILNGNLRKHERTEDRFIFAECILMLCSLFSEILYSMSWYINQRWANYLIFTLPTVVELFYMLTIMQWMVFVDYCLYHSRDHIRRRYKLALIPILVVEVTDALQSFVIYGMGGVTDPMLAFTYYLQFIKVFVELLYIITAVKLVTVYERESREPAFLRLDAFIIPFVLGCFFRYYSGPLMVLGIILTYLAAIRRDRYLDPDTGLFNRDYLDFLGKYRDRKNYGGGNGILIEAPGHGEDMAALLTELRPADSYVFILNKDRFLLLSESLKGSAVKMAVMTITEETENSEKPYTPVITSVSREKDESAGMFLKRLSDFGASYDAARNGAAL